MCQITFIVNIVVGLNPHYYWVSSSLYWLSAPPRWLEYCLNEKTVSKYVQFGINVFGIDASLNPMEIAKKSVNLLSSFFFYTLGLEDTFTKVGIKQEDFPVMAQKACGGSTLQGFIPLKQDDIENIFKMCL